MNRLLQKNQISFEEYVYYLKGGRKLLLSMEHTLNELTLFCLNKYLFFTKEKRELIPI